MVDHPCPVAPAVHRAGAQTVSAVRLRNNRTASGSEGRLEVQIGGQVRIGCPAGSPLGHCRWRVHWVQISC